MAIKVEEVLEFLAIKDTPEDIDKFKEAFSKDFVAKSQALLDPEISAKASSKLGERIGKTEFASLKQFKEFGIDKVEGDKLEDILDNGFKALKVKFEAEKDAGKKTKSERERDLEEENGKFKTKVESLSGMLDKANQLYESEKKGRAEFETNFKIQDQYKAALGKVPFTEEYKTRDALPDAFLARNERRLKIGLDDNGVAIPLKPDGTPFTNAAGNKNPSLLEVLTDFADQDGFKANNKVNRDVRDQRQPERKVPPGQEQPRFLDRSRK